MGKCIQIYILWCCTKYVAQICQGEHSMHNMHRNMHKTMVKIINGLYTYLCKYAQDYG
jgi:hypothetical protein